MRLLASAAALAATAPLILPGQPSVRPWPVGAGPAYRPAPRGAVVEAARPLGALRCAPPGPTYPLHLELFADREVIVVPAGIGVASPLRAEGAAVEPRGCVYPLSTRTPTGVVEVARGARLRLADLFRVWGQPLGRRRLASFSSSAPVLAYVDGRRVRGPAGAIPLTPHAEIVLEIGGYIAPHASFLFAGDGT